MSVGETFNLGLLVTGMGMGLVFMTLLIVMALIWALDKVFRPKPELEEPEKAAPVGATVPVAVAEADLSDEVAAIVTAIELERQKQASVSLSYDYDGEILGQVVTVVTVDPGQSTWKGYGRIQAAH